VCSTRLEYRCAVCGATFASPQSVARHFARRHGRLMPEWWRALRSRGGRAPVSLLLAELESAGLVERVGGGEGARRPPSYGEALPRLLSTLLERASAARSQTVEMPVCELARRVFGSSSPALVRLLVEALLGLGEAGGGWRVLVRRRGRGRKVKYYAVLTRMAPEEAARLIPGVLSPEGRPSARPRGA